MTENRFDHPARPHRFSNTLPMGCNCRDRAYANLQATTPRHRPAAGFTLIEITVVVFLIGILLLVAMPRLPEAPLTDHTRKASRWLVFTVKELKQRSVREQKTYSLQVDLDANRFWIIREDMSEEEKLAAAEEAYRPGDNVRITDVEFPQRDQVNAGRSEIRFYPRGYSDRAIVHIDDGKQRYSFRVEPFLSSVKIYETYVGYKRG